MADKRRGYDDRKAKTGPRTRPLTEQEKRDRAIISVMKDWPLQPGQMLFLGPRSVAALTDGGNDYNPGQLTDRYILDKSEWGVI